MVARFRPQAFLGLLVLAGICGAAIFYNESELAALSAGGIIAIVTKIVDKD